MDGAATQHPSRGVPAAGVVVFVSAVAAGVCAAVSLLIDLGSGVSGFYSNGWVAAFLASFGAMLVLFGLSIGIGIVALKRRGAVDALDRSRLAVLALELVAMAALATAVHFNVGGDALPLLVDLLVLVLVGGLVTWNLWLWRRLIA